jgi:hypothetical protein
MGSCYPERLRLDSIFFFGPPDGHTDALTDSYGDRSLSLWVGGDLVAPYLFLRIGCDQRISRWSPYRFGGTSRV